MSEPEQPRAPSEQERHSVVALRYADTDSAPRVVAKGYGDIAQAIIDRAHAHDLYVHRSPELVRLLMRLDLDDRIPPELYVAIAELLAWVYELEAAVEPNRAD